MHSFLVKAVPTRSLGALAIALQILLTVVGEHVVFAGNKVDLFWIGRLQRLVERIELTRLRKLAEIAGVNDKVRRMG